MPSSLGQIEARSDASAIAAATAAPLRITIVRRQTPMLQQSGTTGDGAPSVWRRAFPASVESGGTTRLLIIVLDAFGFGLLHRDRIMTEQFDNKDKAWSARFSEPVSELVKRYTASVGFDQRLAMVDIRGSLAHAEMLAHVGVLSPADLQSIRDGFVSIEQEIRDGVFHWSVDLEDVHLNIERRLTELVGDAGKRLHTGALAQ